MRQRIGDLALLVARIVVGVTFLAHAYQKFVMNGIGATAKSFEGMGIPQPALAAWTAALVEALGGVSLILGVLLPLFGVLLALDMVGALVLVHASAGFFVTQGGFEYVLVLAAVSLALGFRGGRFALDQLFGRRVARSAG